MSYGHAERNLAAVRVLCAETMWLLANREVLTPDEKQWLDEVTAAPPATRERRSDRLKSNDSTTPSSHRTGSAVA